MHFRLHEHESISACIHRLYHEEVEHILHVLTAQPGGLDEAVHDTRTGLKRIRTLIRLVRDEVGQDFFQKFNGYYRDTGRLLAPLRDGAVLIKTLKTVQDRHPEVLPQMLGNDILALLESNFETSQYKALEEDDVIERVIHRLDERSFVLPLERDGFTIIRDGLRRIYRDGRKAMHAAYAADPYDPHLFHDWRKQVKYLWYALNMLESIWPRLMTPHNEALHELSDYLGDDHDLAVLYETLATSNILREARDLSPVLNRIRSDQFALERQARPLGCRLYADRPRPFTDRIETYWLVWNSQMDEHPKPADEP